MVPAAAYLLGVLEIVTAVGRVQAFEVEIAAALARGLAIALDLPALALVAEGLVSVDARRSMGELWWLRTMRLRYIGCALRAHAAGHRHRSFVWQESALGLDLHLPAHPLRREVGGAFW